MRYLLALILPPFAILTCGKPVSFAFNVIVYGLAWVFLVTGMFLAVIPIFGLGTLAPLPFAFVFWVLAALHAVLVITGHVNEQRQRESGGRPWPASAAFDWMLLVLVCAYFGWRLFFRVEPASTDSLKGKDALRNAPTPAPVMKVAPVVAAEPPPPPAVPTATLDAQKRAMAAFPSLGVAGSPLNREFIARHKRYQAERPSMFTDPDWPLKLATECAEALRGKQ